MEKLLTENEILKIIEVIPSLLWILFAVFIFMLFYKRIRDELLPNLTGLKAMGIEFSFVKSSIDAAIEFGEKSPKWQIRVPEKDKEGALKRAKQNLSILNNARILWVDDHPENNRNERRMFWQLRTITDTATNSSAALEMLKIDVYDLVISDIGRDEEEDISGLEFLERLREFDKKTPVLFYVGELDPKLGVPAGAFGITNRPDELLHLTIDSLARKHLEDLTKPKFNIAEFFKSQFRNKLK